MITFTCLVAFLVNTLAGSIMMDQIMVLLCCHLVITGIYISFVPVWMFESIIGKSYIHAILIGIWVCGLSCGIRKINIVCNNQHLRKHNIIYAIIEKINKTGLQNTM